MSVGKDSSIFFALSVHRSRFTVHRQRTCGVFYVKVPKDDYFYFLCYYNRFIDDFTQFDAFERCREFARGIAQHLTRGAFSKDPVLATALRKTLLSVYSNFGEGFERDGNREFAQFVSLAKGSIGELAPN
jgi:23S rRNA-intervening sequence protein